MSEALTTKQFSAGSCYSYILSSRGQAVIIDPHISLMEVYTSYLSRSRLALAYILDTHTHADHFSLAAVLKKTFSVPVLMHEKSVSEVADRRLKDKDVLTLGNASLEIIYGPGHTDDTVCVFTGGAVFTADVLLIGSVGRTDFQNGSPESMFDTLQRLKTLPAKTRVYPGHDYNQKFFSSLAQELARNPYMRETDKAQFVAGMRAKKLTKPFNMDNIVRVNQTGQASALTMVTPRQASALLAVNSNIKLLDVRSAFEFSQVRIQGALNVPIDMLGAKVQELSATGDKYIVLCRTGNRSPMAADMLVQAGLMGISVMDGGIEAWEKERLPVIKGQGGVSLERQVRLIAGCIVLLGIILAMTVHWGFIGIAIFVSCGLIFSGITDTCLMGMLLLKLPYNKKLYKIRLGGGTCAMDK